MSRFLIFLAILAVIISLAVGAIFLGSKTQAQAEAPCSDDSCFLTAVRACEPASFEPGKGTMLGAGARYQVLGPDGETCQLGFSFKANSNPDLVGKSLSFTVNSDAVTEGVIIEAVEGCLDGRDDGHQCTGPLAGVRAEPAQEVDADAGSGPLPCGQTVASQQQTPLYPMPKDGKWGYLNRDGEWIIAPQWARAKDFSEGRAAVGGQRAWGIIDREGDYVVEMRHENDSFVTIDGQHWGDSPFTPYSEGCTVANIFKQTALRPFYIDRDGKEYWRETLPESLQTRDILNLGSFSEGLAWFEQAGSEVFETRFGWIDPNGEIVIEPDFVEAGDFSEGLAPASSRDGSAGYISPDGKLKLPGKWTLDDAAAFSEGLARVSTGSFDLAFMNKEDFVFERVTFDADGGDRPAEVEMVAAGDFHDGLAPVKIYTGERYEFVYVTREGKAAFVPDDLDGIRPCVPSSNKNIPEFHNGLVRLVVADDGKACNADQYYPGMADYEDAHYVYLDTAGEIVFEQEK